MAESENYAYDEIVEGAEITATYRITPQVYEGFLRAFEDHSPIHVDEDLARRRGFAGRVMHGGILNGFVSHFVGMRFPGRQSLLLSVQLQYSQPSYLHDELALTAKIAQKLDVKKVIILNVNFFNQTQGYPAASGRVQIALQ